MAASFNPLTIEDLPEISSLLSTDRMIFFTENAEGKTMPYLVDLSSFQEYVLSAGALDDLSSKVAELETRYKEIERDMNNTYMTPEQVSAQYSSLTYFNQQIAKIETTEHFKAVLSSKADKTYLEFKTNEVKNDTQAYKRYLGADIWKGSMSTDGDTGIGYKVIALAKASAGVSAA